MKQINSEIQAIIRQITASVTFLPIIEEKCTFNILIYADKGVQVPTTWIDSDPHHVKNSEQVRLRSFSTTVHRVDAMVAYRRDPDLL
ncbi:Mitotic spindle checkpoint component mad2 [Smittium culicis]|nr:Mitotic spindle checkpoint component mad2 [Smittium culicis]